MANIDFKDSLNKFTTLVKVNKMLGAGALSVALILGIGYYMGYEQGLSSFTSAENKITTRIIHDQSPIQTKIITKYLYKTKIIKGNVIENDKIIEKYVPDNNYEFSNGWVYSYNTSLQGAPIDPTSAADGTSSKVTANRGLQTIAENNGICELNAEELRGLQQYILDTNASIKKANSNG